MPFHFESNVRYLFNFFVLSPRVLWNISSVTALFDNENHKRKAFYPFGVSKWKWTAKIVRLLRYLDYSCYINSVKVVKFCQKLSFGHFIFHFYFRLASGKVQSLVPIMGTNGKRRQIGHICITVLKFIKQWS